MKGNEEAVSEVLDETLIIALGIVCAVITVMLVFGALPALQKSAYIVPQYGLRNVSGGSVIYLFDRGGDPVYFTDTPNATYRVNVYVDTTAGSFRAIPVSGLESFRPGDLVFLCYTGSGVVMTRDLTGIPVQPLPPGKVTVRMVDAVAGVLLNQEIVVRGPETSNITATTTATTTATATAATTVPVTTATANITATPTANATATATATATVTATATATATPTPGTLVANFNWVAQGLGGDIHFTDTSTGSPTSWSWNVCGTTLTSQNPVKNIGKKATCIVTLTVTRSSDGATSAVTKTVTSP